MDGWKDFAVVFFAPQPRVKQMCKLTWEDGGRMRVNESFLQSQEMKACVNTCMNEKGIYDA